MSKKHRNGPAKPLWEPGQSRQQYQYEVREWAGWHPALDNRPKNPSAFAKQIQDAGMEIGEPGWWTKVDDQPTR